jgi:hypothetical protein
MARQKPDQRRVFCIGWHKTGTSTLGLALIRLGYSVVGCRLDMVHPLRRGDLEAVLDVAGQFDAVQDVPWAALYRELDERYPGSRFILTERDDDSWLRSARRHFKNTEIALHEWLYGRGRLIGNEKLYLDRYRRHNSEVREYFAGRPDEFLVMNLAEGDGWAVLCGFLGYPVPQQLFPHANKGPHSYTFFDKTRAGFRRLVPMPLRKAVFATRRFARALLGFPDPRNRFNNFHENRRELAAQRSRGPRQRAGKEASNE